MSSSLEMLLADISACRTCKDKPVFPIKNPIPLPHEPRPVVVASKKAQILIVGQAPGIKVHESGIPFDDRSGDRLRDWMGLSSQQFYDRNKVSIVPMGFCFPGYSASGSDIAPRKECAPKWRKELLLQMPQIKLLLVIGLYARNYHLPERKKENLYETVLDWKTVYSSSSAPRVLPLPHPSWRNNSWLKKNPWFDEVLKPLLRLEVASLI